jgi:hypothetical protein
VKKSTEEKIDEFIKTKVLEENEYASTTIFKTIILIGGFAGWLYFITKYPEILKLIAWKKPWML